jgi:hypothetical protein
MTPVLRSANAERNLPLCATGIEPADQTAIANTATENSALGSTLCNDRLPSQTNATDQKGTVLNPMVRRAR